MDTICIETAAKTFRFVAGIYRVAGVIAAQ